MLDAWVAPIKLDPNWKGGDYHAGPEPPRDWRNRSNW